MNAPTLPFTDQPGPNPNTGIGANNPPPEAAFNAEELAALKDKVDAFIKASDVWLKTPITTKELAEQLSDQIAGLRKVFKEADGKRKAQKTVWDDKGKEVQAAYTPILDQITKAADLLKAPLLAWELEQERIAEAAKAEARRLANEAAAEARRLAMDAEQSGSIAAKVEAEAAEAAAAKQAKEANRKIETGVKSASGAGRTMSTRTRLVCQIERLSALFTHYRENPKVAEVLLSLANAEANSKDFDLDAGHTIPGVTITKSRTIA